MITAVDTSILLDILTSHPDYSNNAFSMFQRALNEGKVIICPVVWSELRPFFKTTVQMEETLEKMSLTFDDFGKEVATRAGELWREYRQKKGSRQRILGDFLVGAHAELKADRFLTRDQGFYRPYFRNLVLLES